MSKILISSLIGSTLIFAVACSGSSDPANDVGGGEDDVTGASGQEEGSGGSSTGGETGGGGGNAELADRPEGPIDCDFTTYCNYACLAPGDSSGACTALELDFGQEFGVENVNDAVIDEDIVYMAASGRITSMPVAGGALTHLTTEHGGDHIAVGAGYVFYTRYVEDASEIIRIPVDGGAGEVIFTGPKEPAELEFSGGRLFFLSQEGQSLGQNEVMSINTDGTDHVIHGDGGDNPAVELAAGAGSVFWFQNPKVADDSLVTAASDATFPTVIGEEKFGQLLTTYGDNLYWIASNDTLREMPLSGGSPTTIWDDFDSGWQNRDLVGTSKGLVAKLNEEVLIIPFDGGEPVLVAHVSPNMSAFAANADYAYIFAYGSTLQIKLP